MILLTKEKNRETREAMFQQSLQEFIHVWHWYLPEDKRLRISVFSGKRKEYVDVFNGCHSLNNDYYDENPLEWHMEVEKDDA